MVIAGVCQRGDTFACSQVTNDPLMFPSGRVTGWLLHLEQDPAPVNFVMASVGVSVWMCHHSFLPQTTLCVGVSAHACAGPLALSGWHLCKDAVGIASL